MSSTPSHSIVLITGGNTGVGFATIQGLLSAPATKAYTIILTSRSLSRAEEAVKTLKSDAAFAEAFKNGSQLVPVELDLDSEASVKALREAVGKKVDRIDTIVNNAGVNHDFTVAAGKMSTRDGFEKAFSTNVVSVHLFTEAFVDLLLKSPSPRIVFISSGIASIGDHSNPHVPVNKSPPAGWPKGPQFSTTMYRTSKAAMSMMAMEWKRNLKNDGVVVHIVDPGWLATGLGGGKPEDMKARGAGDPIEGGKFIRTVIEGDRDADEGKMVTKDGIIPW